MSWVNGIKDLKAYCFTHTPLMLKKYIERAEERQRKQIWKFGWLLEETKVDFKIENSSFKH